MLLLKYQIEVEEDVIEVFQHCAHKKKFLHLNRNASKINTHNSYYCNLRIKQSKEQALQKS